MKELEQLLAASRAADEFKDDVRRYYAGRQAPRIGVEGHAPAVKVQRLLKQVLSAEADLPIERLALRARSGCSDFVGVVEVEAAGESHAFEFLWDCRWKAEQEGWTDWFGLPDQIRAAQEFDWRCFRSWIPTSRVSSRRRPEPA